MRRRSERKKSTDVVASPVPSSRRSRRSIRKSVDPEVETADRMEDDNEMAKEEAASSTNAENTTQSEDEGEEPIVKKRSSRQKTPIKEKSSPSKGRRNAHRAVSPSANKIAVIPEEENGQNAENESEHNNAQPEDEKEDPAMKSNEQQEEEQRQEDKQTEKAEQEDNNKEVKDDKNSTESSAQCANEEEVKIKTLDVTESSTTSKLEQEQQENKEEHQIPEMHHAENQNDKQAETLQETAIAKDNYQQQQQQQEEEQEEGEITADSPIPQKTSYKPISIKANGRQSHSNNAEDSENSNMKPASARKRKWITKKTTQDNKAAVLSISTDSLKNLISDVHPVPLSDVQLESSSEVEELASEREEGEKTPSPERERSTRPLLERTISTNSNAADAKTTIKRSHNDEKSSSINNEASKQIAGVDGIKKTHRSPSPARHQASCVLYITNLVRPFTVLQLKGLLARTGKIVEEDGFWIDRIKSKCYVQYETEE